MSSRPAGRTAFENLRPTILRQPSRSHVSAEAEARLLDSPPAPAEQGEGSAALRSIQAREEFAAPSLASIADEVAALPARALLKKKKRDLLVPVTFRMPQSLKERLEQTAKLHEINQTDLINEAIDLNLQRYS